MHELTEKINEKEKKINMLPFNDSLLNRFDGVIRQWLEEKVEQLTAMSPMSGKLFKQILGLTHKSLIDRFVEEKRIDFKDLSVKEILQQYEEWRGDANKKAV